MSISDRILKYRMPTLGPVNGGRGGCQVEKLVRDRIPDIIRGDGRDARVRTAVGTELASLLSTKLLEEASEFASAPSLEELADVFEVIRALLDAHGWSLSDLEAAADAKRRERGGFARGLVLSLDLR
jgi:predicted house-cleaning noncanonical NTP pyrophosphatase (MazG superfamily)